MYSRRAQTAFLSECYNGRIQQNSAYKIVQYHVHSRRSSDPYPSAEAEQFRGNAGAFRVMYCIALASLYTAGHGSDTTSSTESKYSQGVRK
jgi:hypothetical protein